jgi:hypothetical protein
MIYIISEIYCEEIRQDTKYEQSDFTQLLKFRIKARSYSCNNLPSEALHSRKW